MGGDLVSKKLYYIIVSALKNRFLFSLVHKAIKLTKKMEENLRKKQANKTVMHLQDKLLHLTNEMWKNREICFTTVRATSAPGGNYWQPAENIKGDYIYKTLETNPDGIVKISNQVADDYQKLIAEYQKRNYEVTGNLLDDGKNWLFGKLLMWGGSIVEEGLISHQEITELTGTFEDVVNKKGENFFGYFHGNVIGDHIYVGEDKTFYLLGMRIVPRPGKGYYDFLRILDWLLLKTDSQVIEINQLVGWMKQYLTQYNWEEVKLVFALRCIGILGWDMLHRGDLGKGDTEAKKKLLLQFIRRTY
jgi:hypothetical protein